MNRLVFLVSLFLSVHASADPLFSNSIVSNDLEFLTPKDETSFYCLKFLGKTMREMPDKSRNKLMVDHVYNFEAWFTDGSTIGIWVHPDLGDRASSEAVVRQIIEPIGRLPYFMRKKLHHVVIHDGDETAFAEDLGRFFVLYDDNIIKRILSHDLEETVFHEAVHATLDIPLARSKGWKAAQVADGDFVTKYAMSRPDSEDLAESSLFAYTYFQHPDRLPEEVRANLQALIPNRLALLSEIFGPNQEMQRAVDQLESCDS